MKENCFIIKESIFKDHLKYIMNSAKSYINTKIIIIIIIIIIVTVISKYFECHQSFHGNIM